MVFFCCDGCGETLKKSHVDAHANRCRRCDSVSCVDCSVSFFGDDYRMHTSCITEAERYEGKFAKTNSTTKRNPQQEWMNIVESCVTTAPSHLKGYLQTMSGLDNIPRKEKQFRNFTANSLNLRGRSEAIVGEIWNVLKTERDKRLSAKEKQQKEQQQQQQETKEDIKTLSTSKEPKEESKPIISPTSTSDEGKESSSTDKSSSIDKKAVHKAMKKALKKAPNKAMKIKELRKYLSEKLDLPKNAKKQLKELILNSASSSLTSKDLAIKVDGKMVSLL